MNASFWHKQIAQYEKVFGTWEKRADGIVKRYKDERDRNKTAARFNILWSNVQTLAPAIYNNPPKPNIERRRKDYDNTSRAVSQVLEKSVSYFADSIVFDEVMRQIVLDRLLAGRGTVWVRYVPEIANDELYSEDVVVDYVYYKDFGHTLSRVWQDVPAVWRKIYKTRAELNALFENLSEEQRLSIPLDAKSSDREDEISDKACIYEIWDKNTKKVYFISSGCDFILKEEADPLKLKGFFPCPKPLFASVATDNLIPLPDYLQYQDQAIELDELTGRIQQITKALKVVGVYDSSAEGVQRILEQGVENKLIPVSNWALFGEKGGLKGVVDYFPMQDVMTVLASLYQAREAVKQALYEISGISDIVRGASKASETATAQRIKGQFATLRLDAMQKDVARFARDVIGIMTEIIAEHFDLDTIKQISGVPLLTEQEKLLIQQGMQMGQPVPQNVIKMMKEPTWEQVYAIIKDDMARCFSIDVETDSTIKIDQEQDKKERGEFLAAASNFLQQAVQVEDPKMRPLLAEMLMFGVRGFKVGRDLEAAFITYLDDAKQVAEQPPAPPPPDPSLEISRMQAQQQAEANQAQMQIKSAELQLKKEVEIAGVQIKQQELQLESRSLDIKEQEIMINAELEKARMQADMQKTILATVQQKQSEMESESSEPEEPEEPKVDIMAVVDTVSAALQNGLSQIAQAQVMSSNNIASAIANPPEKKIVRDKAGNITGVK